MKIDIIDSKLFRLFNVAGVAAIGHLLSVFIIPFAANNLGSEAASNIAIIESSFLLVSSILGFGLSLVVTRDVSKSDEWTDIVTKCVSARLSLSILIQLTSVLFYFFDFIGEISFICFLLSPLIALNVDFVLYGRDMPVKAAYSSFIRMSLPVLSFILIAYFFSINVEYLLLVVLFQALSILFVFNSLDFIPKETPKISSLTSYKPVFFIGIASFFIVFQRVGFLSFFDFQQEELICLSIILKFYLAFVAVRRLFIQTFYVSLLSKNIYQKVEVFCFLSALSVAAVCGVFPEYISLFLFNDSSIFHIKYIYCFAVLIISGSFFSTADARLFLKNKDDDYYSSAFISFIVWLFLFSLVIAFDFNGESVILALSAAELILALSYKYFLVKQ